MSTIFAGTTVSIPLPVTVVSTGAAVDPTAFVVTVQRATAVADTYTYGVTSGTIFVRDGVGLYHLIYTTLAGAATATYTVVATAGLDGNVVVSRRTFQVTAT